MKTCTNGPMGSQAARHHNATGKWRRLPTPPTHMANRHGAM